MKVIIYGIDGVMGQMLQAQIEKKADITWVAGIAPRHAQSSSKMMPSLQDCSVQADVVIDFSHPSNLADLLAYGQQTHTPLLLCTTGYTHEDLVDIETAAQSCPILLSTNTSYGINLMRMLLEKIVPYLEAYDIEVIEKHHNRKIDAPSGTAKTLLKTIEGARQMDSQRVYGRDLTSGKRQDGDIGIHAVRGGTIAGEHTVLFAGEEELLEIKHTALSRKVFAEGALKAAQWLIKQANGFYAMSDMFND